MHSVACPDDTMKVWQNLVYPPGRSCISNKSSDQSHQTPSSLYLKTRPPRSLVLI